MNALQNLLSRLRQSYLGEVPGRLDEIEQLVMKIESAGYETDSFGELYRHVHSLKGSGGTYGVQIITTICHPLEDYLSTITSTGSTPAKNFATVVLTFIDLLRDSTTRAAQAEDNFLDIESRLATLRQEVFTPPFSALVIETASSSIKLISKVLEKQRCRMVLMSNGYFALGRALSEPFDVIITSVETEQLNGSALVAALKITKGPNERTKTILLTANESLPRLGPQPDFRLLKNADMLIQLESAVKSTLGPAQE